MNPIMFSISTLLVFQTKHVFKISKLSVSSRKFIHEIGERPPNPSLFQGDVQSQAQILYDWFHGKQNVLCITGAGISTDSGIPDYRGNNGSYYKNHVPTLHHEFIHKEQTRKRYWARSLIGWKEFANAVPNDGHVALSTLERLGKIGVSFDDCMTYDKNDDIASTNHNYVQVLHTHEKEANLDYAFTNGGGSRRVSIITQNVDRLHSQAGSKYILHLHGRNDILKCQSCASEHCRHEYHQRLEELNGIGLEKMNFMNATTRTNTSNNNNSSSSSTKADLRPDGDAELLWSAESLNDFQVPNCSKCTHGILKPDVVFFGDSVPRHRVDECYAAVNACDGLLVIGSSLTVHSAYRFVTHASHHGDKPIAILNMGITRAESSGIHVTKVDAPIGPTLMELVKLFSTKGD